MPKHLVFILFFTYFLTCYPRPARTLISELPRLAFSRVAPLVRRRTTRSWNVIKKIWKKTWASLWARSFRMAITAISQKINSCKWNVSLKRDKRHCSEIIGQIIARYFMTQTYHFINKNKTLLNVDVLFNLVVLLGVIML